MMSGEAAVMAEESSLQSPDLGMERSSEEVLVGPPFSEDALATEFASRLYNELLFVPELACWMTWDNAKWVKDHRLTASNHARVICREKAAALLRSGRGGDAVKLTSAKSIQAVERLARSDVRLARRLTDFDVDPFLLNTPDGVVELRTGGLRERQQHELFTRVAGATPDGSCPRFLEFLGEITQGNRDLQDYIQRFFGYTLTGDTSEQAFLFAFGPGGNGKSVLFNILAAALGDYATTAMEDVFTASYNDQHSTHLASLRGARMIIVGEIDAGRSWAEGRLKAFTAGDEMSARVMRGDPFKFKPIGKIWCAGNHKPQIRNPDAAMRRRMNLVPFNFVPQYQDKSLFETLRGELAGIMAWAIDGCLDWQKHALKPPAVVSDSTTEYFSDQDVISTWFGQRCRKSPGRDTPSRDLYHDWKRWAQEGGEIPGSEKRFSEMLNRLVKKKKTNACTVFLGITLVTAGESCV